MRVDFFFFLILALVVGIFAYPSPEPPPAAKEAEFTESEEALFTAAEKSTTDLETPATVVAEVEAQLKDVVIEPIVMPEIDHTPVDLPPELAQVETLALEETPEVTPEASKEKDDSSEAPIPPELAGLDEIQETWVVVANFHFGEAGKQSAFRQVESLQNQKVDAFVRSDTCSTGDADGEVLSSDCWIVFVGPIASMLEAVHVKRRVSRMLEIDVTEMDIWKWEVSLRADSGI